MSACPECGKENPDGFQFCGFCAAPLTGDSREQRKTVTVLFCDVTGSTALGESTDPEALRALLARYFERMRELGIVLPPVFPPVGNYLGCVVDGDLVWVGGHGPEDGERRVTGKVGADLSLEQGRKAARMAGLSILATLQAELGDLDRIERIVKVFGMVNCAPGFNRTPAVIDGCSDLLVELFGEAGRHTRAAVGMAELPFDIAVEIELLARIR